MTGSSFTTRCNLLMIFSRGNCRQSGLIWIALILAFSGLPLAVNANAIKTYEKTEPVPMFQLEDQHGKGFTKENLKGRWTLMFLGFTSCPDVCPMTLTRLEAVRAEMGLRLMPEKIPAVVFLAVDPERDAAILKNYMAHFHPEHTGITGDPEQIDILVKGIGEFYRLDKIGHPGAHYDVVHSASVLVINPDAEVVAKIPPPLPVEQTSVYLNQLIRTHDDPSPAALVVE